MASAANCCVRRFRQLGKRQTGISLEPRWLDDIGIERGDKIGVDLDSVDDRRVAVLLLGDYDEDAVGWEVVVGDRDGTPVATLPEGVSDILDVEVEQNVLMDRTDDRRRIRVEVP